MLCLKEDILAVLPMCNWMLGDESFNTFHSACKFVKFIFFER